MRLLELYNLFEAKCPYCGAEGAYVGLHDVECKNPNCRHSPNYGKGDSGQSGNFTWKSVKWSDILNEPRLQNVLMPQDIAEPDDLEWILWSDGVAAGSPKSQSHAGTSVVIHPQHGTMFEELGWDTSDDRHPMDEDEIAEFFDKKNRKR